MQVYGTLIAAGTEAQRVRIGPSAPGARWGGIYGQRGAGLAQPGSAIALSYVDIAGGGAGGTLLASEAGQGLLLSSCRIVGNGGQIRALDTPVTIEGTEIGHGEIPYGAAVDLTFDGAEIRPDRRAVRMAFSRVADNTLSAGAAPLSVTNSSPRDPVQITLLGNLLGGAQGPDLALYTDSPLTGSAVCNTLAGGTVGLRLTSQNAPPNLWLAMELRANAIERVQIAADNSTYQRLGIGQGASSDLGIDMAQNWWGSPSGPYAPTRNPGGRGAAAGVNVQFSPWLAQRPDCAPE